MLSQFFILSPRGDALVTKDFRRDLPRRTHETFYRTVRAWARSRRREDGEEDGTGGVGDDEEDDDDSFPVLCRHVGRVLLD